MSHICDRETLMADNKNKHKQYKKYSPKLFGCSKLSEYSNFCYFWKHYEEVRFGYSQFSQKVIININKHSAHTSTANKFFVRVIEL